MKLLDVSSNSKPMPFDLMRYDKCIFTSQLFVAMKRLRDWSPPIIKSVAKTYNHRHQSS